MKSYFHLVLFLVSSFFLFQSTHAQKTLWYEQPAVKWEEALPLGNGRLGAMVFGQPDMERIQLNEDSLWPGNYADWGHAIGGPEDIQAIRALLIAGENKLADDLLVEKFSRKGITRSHQTLGDLWLDLGHQEINQYRRELDLEQALVKVTYLVEGHKFTQQVFASAADDVLVIKITSAHPKGINGKISLSRPEDAEEPTVKVFTDHNQLVMEGEVTQRKGMIDSKPTPILHGVKFETRLEILQADGDLLVREDHLMFEGVKSATLVLVANTDFYEPNFVGKNLVELQRIKKMDFNRLLERHVWDYQDLFNRVHLDLGGATMEQYPTDQRIQRVKEGEVDTGLESLLFDYGRYLLISCSRPGTNPANLQGLWNQHIAAPWNADYHLNINYQMNYWPAEVTNLSELHEPFFDFTDGLISSGKETARETFGIRGSGMGHTTDLWQTTYLQAQTAYWGGWIGAGGWLMQHYWERYLFTMDTSFLRKRTLPVLTEVARFYADWLIPHPIDSLLVSAPSTSPENSFINLKGDSVASTMGAAMDQQIIQEVFENYIKTCETLELETELLTEVREKLAKLRPGMVIGDDGRILEWDRAYEEPEKGHRHMSHLYAFHPGNKVSATSSPELFAAVRKSLDYRLQHGGAGTGWSRAWLINFSARLLDGEMAHQHVLRLIKDSLYPNLFDAHPPFQIDGNFGYTAGVAEMLLQSHEPNTIRLLPALPKAWSSGKVSGLKARGNYTLDMAWEKGQLTKLKITAQKGGNTTLLYGASEIEIELGRGESFVMDMTE
ncbi:glycoside hydrolase family 95 protein [Pararhodonellum marinum]|uniref:glycoside hydrolase family 95 protein n=1 Tax=Pararhodonellum marinum TaxID=2755358 RepID=UPI00188DDE01|nr:glycoside hydrolase family 95 protein [Pararhodonellum marinum]